MSNRKQIKKKSATEIIRDEDVKPTIEQMSQTTDNVLLYCAHLEKMLHKLQSDYDRLQDRQEEILNRLKGDKDDVVISMQKLFDDFSNSLQHLVDSSNRHEPEQPIRKEPV